MLPESEVVLKASLLVGGVSLSAYDWRECEVRRREKRVRNSL